MVALNEANNSSGATNNNNALISAESGAISTTTDVDIANNVASPAAGPLGLDVVFIIEASAHISPYTESLKTNYITPTLE